jgi:uncharacterized membrane protein YfcA
LFAHLLVYLLLGCIASFIAGLLGVGGGLILIPGLLFVFTHFQIAPADQIMHLCIGTSLAASIINLLIAVRTHHRNHAVTWSLFFSMTPGVLLGALLLGPAIMEVINVNYLKIIFGLFCLLVSINMLTTSNKHIQEKPLPGFVLLSLLGLGIGGLSTILGIAGGAMIGTMLTLYGLNTRKVIGTTSAICLIIAIAGTTGLLFVGYDQTALPAYSTGYIYWPALLGIALPSLIFTPAGATLAHKMPVNLLKKIFAGLVLVIGLKMLLSG